MKDIPIFTASNGIASLILREIPHRGEGYVLVRAVFTDLEALLRECAGFCRAAGAKKVYFSGNADFTGYPVYAQLIERQVPRSALPKVSARAVATDSEEWTALYREKFRTVPVAQTCTKPEHAYFIVENGERIGLGQVEGEWLRSVAALKKGAGQTCVCALAALAQGGTLRLLCAKENARAMRLYDTMGFSCESVKEVWYCEK